MTGPQTFWIGPCPTPGSSVWASVVQEHASVRHSLDGALCVVKWRGNRPANLPSGGVSYSDENPLISASLADLRSRLASPEFTEPEV